MTKFSNPMIIKKELSPYLSLSDYSGIYLNSYSIPNNIRGIELPLNPNNFNNFNLMALQFWARFPNSSFSSNLTVLAIELGGTTITINLVVDSNGARATLESSNPVSFYQNGVEVFIPVIRPKQWNSFHIVFPVPLSIPSNARIVLYPEFVFNNIAQFIYENEIDTYLQSKSLSWSQVLVPNLANPSAMQTWQDVYDLGTWIEAASIVILVNDFLSDGQYIYNNQTGTSVITIEDDSGFNIYSNGTDIITNVEWITIEKQLV